MSFWDRLVGASRSQTSLHCWRGDQYDTAPWRDVVADGERTTAGLRKLGVAPGGKVAGILTNTPSAIRGLVGVWLAGGAFASLPLRSRGMDADEHGRQIQLICEQLGTELLLVDEESQEQLPPWLCERLRVVLWSALADSGRVDPCPPGEDETAFIQFSSGSTGTPKGCMLTARAIADQTDLEMIMTGSSPRSEQVVSWMPISHDMGIFGGLIACMLHDLELYLSSPQRFAMSPRSWFRDLSELRATVTFGTNTGLAYGTRPYRRRGLEKPLDALRVCVLGAERIEWTTLMETAEVFRGNGLRREALMPAYGLAEATLAVTATPLEEIPRYLTVDSVALADRRVVEVEDDFPTAAKIVSAGTPCVGASIHNLDRETLREVQVRSKSLTRGYFADPSRTAEKLLPGGLMTGDLGFERDGRLYLVGRTDDMVSVSGRKVYAREIETAVEILDGIREGTATIVDRTGHGSARLALLVEPGPGAANRGYRGIAQKAAEIAMAKAAVRLDECIFVMKGSLPKTPSGKIQRHRCLQLLEAGLLEADAVIEL